MSSSELLSFFPLLLSAFLSSFPFFTSGFFGLPGAGLVVGVGLAGAGFAWCFLVSFVKFLTGPLGFATGAFFSGAGFLSPLSEVFLSWFFYLSPVPGVLVLLFGTLGPLPLLEIVVEGFVSLLFFYTGFFSSFLGNPFLSLLFYLEFYLVKFDLLGCLPFVILEGAFSFPFLSSYLKWFWRIYLSSWSDYYVSSRVT